MRVVTSHQQNYYLVLHFDFKKWQQIILKVRLLLPIQCNNPTRLRLLGIPISPPRMISERLHLSRKGRIAVLDGHA